MARLAIYMLKVLSKDARYELLSNEAFSLGFTLIECMIFLLLIIILFCFQTPFVNIFYTKKVKIIEQELIFALNYAKAQAIITNETRLIIPVDLSNPPNWAKGIKLQNSKGDTLRIWIWHVDNLKISWHGFKTNIITFVPDLNKSIVNGKFIIIDGYKNKNIFINKLGRIKMDNYAN